uniref:Mic1 domain-containing protein n=1 Tax=Globodera pallida TaxID=36090 RepID=A0A183BTN5_GLOPA
MLNIGANIVNLRTNGTKNIGIFYDSVCTIRTEGEQLTIAAKSADRAYHEILFDIREKFGRVRAVGFSPDLQIASIQQEDSVVEFAVLQDGKVVANFQHKCNFKGAVILGVHWLSNRQIAFVTEAGCEFYLVNAYKRVLKSIQRLATVINWFSFHAPSNLFVCSSGVKNDTMTCLTFQVCGDGNFLVRFLINRRNGESVLLKLLQRAILHKSLKFARITQIFRQILQGSLQEDDVNESGVESPAVSTSKWFPPVASFAPITVSHNSLLRSVFEPLHERQEEVDKRSLASLMFFLILKRTHVKVQETYVSELLVKMLVAADMFDRLQQLLQYSVIEKSKFLAYELITLSSRCPALYQIGLDMLKRRHDWEQIVEVLMTRGHLLEALRLLMNVQIDRVVFNKTLRRLLDLAWKSADRQLMFTVFSHVLYVQGRKHLAEVMSSDDFERYAQEFKLLYDREEVEEAVQRFRKARLSSIRRRSDTTARNDSFTFVPGDEEDDVLMKEGAEEDDNSIHSGCGISVVTGTEQQQETATDTDIFARS